MSEKHAEVVPLPQPQSALSISPDQTDWNDEQIAALMAHCGLGDDVPRGDAYAFLHLCQRTGLDPWAREIYLIGRKVREKNQPDRMKYTAQTGIDGYRHIAERTGEYAGRIGPYWCGPDGEWKDVWLSDEPPAAARVGIVRRDIDTPFYGTVSYREYVPMQTVWENGRKAGEKPQGLWAKMPAHMLAKCAEALAIRTAFPRQVSGVYTDEEMHQADAVATDEEIAAAHAQRAEQRATLIQRPWGPGEPATPAEVAPGDVIDGQVVPDRESLWAELQSQADTLGQTIPAMTRRWVKANRKNIDDATAEELLALVEANRPRVQEAIKAKVAEAVEEVAESTELPPEAVEAAEEVRKPHEYADWGGQCMTCLKPEDDPIHQS